MLVVFGAINLDLVFPVDHLPRAGETVRSPGGWSEPGGKAAVQTLAALRDGAPVRLVGAVGRDRLGDVALAALDGAGVDTTGVARQDGPTGRAAISVTPDGHSITTADPGVNRAAAADLVPDALLGWRTTLLLQQETEPAEIARLIARARRLDTRIILNVSPPRTIDAAALRQVDVLIGDGAELAWLGRHLGTGSNPASIHAATGVTTVRMLGVQGAEAASTIARYLHMPALPVKMRDTTAAADCFVGGFAAALDRELRLPDALRRAAVMGALAVTRVGTGRSFPDAAATDAALARAPEVGTEPPGDEA